MDYFNTEERERHKHFASARDARLAPIVRLLVAARISPNQITTMSVILLIVGCAVSGNWSWTAPFLLFAYCLFDGLDGPLARMTGRVHRGGEIMDMAADQAGVVFVAAAATYHLGSDPVSAILFSNFYIVFIVFVVYSNEKKIGTFWFLKLKYPFFGFYAASIVLIHLGYFRYFHVMNIDLVSVYMFVCAVYYGVSMVRQLLRIYDNHSTLPPGGHQD